MAWLWATLFTLGIYVTVPFARVVSAFVGARWGREIFRDVVLLVIALGAGAAILALRRVRLARRRNYLWLVLVGMGFAYFTMGMQASPEESLHFVEYGVLGFLLFRALSFRTRDDGIYIAAALIGAIAGAFDEVIQWFTPRRVFDFRDIGFNMWAGVLTQFAIAKGFEPPHIEPGVRPATFRRICATGAGLVVLLWACLANTPEWTERIVRWFPRLEFVRHKASAMSDYGYRHEIPGIGVFYSRFTLDELRRLDRERADESARVLNAYHDPRKYGDFLTTYTPVTDPFLHEARVHLFRRDHYRAVAPKYSANPQQYALHVTIAYREHQFMAEFFPETLARSWYRLRETDVEAMRREMDASLSYESAVSDNLITRLTAWQVNAAMASLLVVLAAGWAYSWRKDRANGKEAT